MHELDTHMNFMIYSIDIETILIIQNSRCIILETIKALYHVLSILLLYIIRSNNYV